MYRILYLLALIERISNIPHRIIFLFHACQSTQIWSCLPRKQVHVILSDFLSGSTSDLIFYRVRRPTSRISISFVIVPQQFLVRARDSFADRCLNKILSVWAENRDSYTQHSEIILNTTRVYNGGAGENRTYHWRSEWNWLLHRSWITSKWSESNLTKQNVYN